jgi:hypothetical protein
MAAGLGVASVVAVNAANAAPDAFLQIAPGDLHWVDIPGGHGAQEAELIGGQDHPGFYVVRVRFPPHWMDTPHWHTRDRYITVLQGTWTVGTGPVFDPTKATQLAAGSVMKHPAHGVHWDGSSGDDAVIVQIIGIGPVSTTAIDPKGPEWVHVGDSVHP